MIVSLKVIYIIMSDGDEAVGPNNDDDNAMPPEDKLIVASRSRGSGRR